MGIYKAVKDFIRARWPHCMRNARNLQEAAAHMIDPNYTNPLAPPPFTFPTLVCFDYTAALKYYPPDRVQNGHQYFVNWFLPPITEAFEQGATNVYVCLDRGSPSNKDLEHSKRYKDTELMPAPEFAGEELINDNVIPSPEQWSGFVANKQLVGDLYYYVTQRFMKPQPDSANTFTPAPGKALFLHGGRNYPPNRKIFPIPLPAPEVLFVKNELVEQRSNLGIVNLLPTRVAGASADHTPIQVENLLEAELACLYFARDYPQDDVLFVTPDGDMLLQLLLMAPDRINPETGRFRNTHYLKLKLDGNDDYVNINELYWAIQNDPVLKLYENPVLMFVAASILLKNDYIHDFCYGIKTMPAEGELSGIQDINIPVIYQVMFSQARKFRNLFTIEPKIRMNMNVHCLVHINDDLWTQFVHDLYVFKYRKAASKKFDIPIPAITIGKVMSMLDTYKNINTHVISDKRLRVFGRQLLWVLEYWHNAYRGDCLVNPSHALFKNKSYYGWTILASGDCMPAEEVSEERPSETYNLNNMFKRSWEEFESDGSKDEEKDAGEPSSKRFRISEILHKSKRNYVERRHVTVSAPANQ